MISSGAQVFKVSFENAAAYPPLYVAEDGSVLDNYLAVVVGAPSDETDTVSGHGKSMLLFSDLPQPAISAVRDREPLAVVTNIDQETWGESTVYLIEFEDSLRHPAIYVTAEGIVLKQKPD